MTDGLNRATILGNLGADPELRVTSGGKAVCRMRVATSHSYVDSAGARQEATEWHTCSLWGKRGEAIARLLHKGDRVYLEGALRTSEYEKDGVKRYTTEIVILNVVLCGKKQEGGRPTTATSSRAPSADEPPPGAVHDDDIPF
jgi:single-strand DNA-binding protein